MIGLPKEAFDEDGKLVKYIFWKVDDVPEGKYMTEEYPEDSHIHFWVGEDPADAPDGYQQLREPNV